MRPGQRTGPLFIHAVTMQNHTTYDEIALSGRRAGEYRKAPRPFAIETLSQLRDFATGVHEADAALGELIALLSSSVEEPVIVVFWGDHFNPVGKGSELYEKTGFIEAGRQLPAMQPAPDGPADLEQLL